MISCALRSIIRARVQPLPAKARWRVACLYIPKDSTVAITQFYLPW